MGHRGAEVFSRVGGKFFPGGLKCLRAKDWEPFEGTEESPGVRRRHVDNPSMQVRPSQISAVRYGDVQPNTRPEASPERPSDGVEGPRGRDRADVTPPPPGEGLPDRVANFADKIDERLSNLAKETGQDLSSVQEAFGGFVDRIQNGIADGSLNGADLERGVRNALALTTANVRDALSTNDEGEDFAPGPRPQSPSERIDAFEQRVNDRLGSIAEGADPETIAQLREAQQTFAAGLDGLREGIADGRFDGATLGRAVQSAIASLGGEVQDALAQPTEETEINQGPDSGLPVADAVPTESLAPRLDAFAETFAERLGNLDLSGPEGGAVRSAGAEFLSLLEGLSAGSADGSISAERVTGLFQDALSGISGDLSSLFSRGEGELSLYDRDAERTA